MTRQQRTGDGGRYDVVIVGGGAAGLSGALMLGRARRSVLVVDGGQPRNASAAHVHGFLSRDGTPPGQLLEAGRQDVAHYGGEVVTGRVVAASRVGDGFEIELDTARRVRARQLLVATGITDELPDIAGLAERWGRDVLHCPYCHGWEFRDQPVGVLATGSLAVHQALLFRQWTDKLSLLLHTGPRPTAEEAEQLAARDIAVVTGEVSAVEAAEDQLTGVRLSTGELIPLRALVVAPRSVPCSEVLTALGLSPSPHPSGIGDYVAAQANGLTSVPGVWVAGNLADPATNVPAAVASGTTAAAAINAELVTEDTRRAVCTGRQGPFSSESEARNCERVLGNRRHGL